MQKLKKLLIAGSHGATTAAAIIEEITSRNLPWDIYFIGRKYSSENKKSLSLEYQLLPEMGVRFIEIDSGKIQTKFTEHTIKAILKLPVGFVVTLVKLLQIKPDLILSLGGSNGAVVSFWAWLMRVPVVIHEQTSAAGRANQKSAMFATKVLLARDSSVDFFPKDKIEVVGNPMTTGVIKRSSQIPKPSVKTILITGGSRGSSWINKSVGPILAELCSKYKVVHQTGVEDYENYRNLKIKNYSAVPQVMPNRMVEYISDADIVISRAGANTVSELVALKKPSILVPIPWSYLDEQNQNANYMVKLGLARVLSQSELTGKRLLSEIQNLIRDYSDIIKKVHAIKSIDMNASEKVVDCLEKYI